MPDSNQNIVEFRLTGTLSTSGTSVTVSNDIHRDSAIAVTDASVTLINEQGTVFELVKCTIATGTLTTSKRGLTQAQTLTEDAALKREWRPGTKGFVTSFASDSVDREGDTMTGALSFSGTTNSAIRTSNLTTTQRLALTPANGMIVYDTTIGELYQYIAGAWSAMASGSTQPNASATVAGKVEIATTAQSIAGTDAGETGALLSALPSDIAKNTQSGTFVYATSTDVTDTYTANLTPALTVYTDGMEIRLDVTTANTGACTINLNGLGAKSIKLIDGTDPLDGDIAASTIVELIYNGTNFVLQSVANKATNTEFTTGTDTHKFPTVAQIGSIIKAPTTGLVIGTNYTANKPWFAIMTAQAKYSSWNPSFSASFYITINGVVKCQSYWQPWNYWGDFQLEHTIMYPVKTWDVYRFEASQAIISAEFISII